MMLFDVRKTGWIGQSSVPVAGYSGVVVGKIRFYIVTLSTCRQNELLLVAAVKDVDLDRCIGGAVCL